MRKKKKNREEMKKGEKKSQSLTISVFRATQDTFPLQTPQVLSLLSNTLFLQHISIDKSILAQFTILSFLLFDCVGVKKCSTSDSTQTRDWL